MILYGNVWNPFTIFSGFWQAFRTHSRVDTLRPVAYRRRPTLTRGGAVR